MQYLIKLPPAKYLRECLRYDRKTGKLYWKKRPRKHFTDDRFWKGCNTQYAGKEAFACPNRQKHMTYLTGAIDGVGMKAHRVIWKIVTGKEPPAIIDHKDRNGSNNRWGNLRPASYGQNFLNRTSAWCKSGIIGIRKFNHSGRCWNARIHKDKVCIDLGYFDSCEGAVAARREAEQRLYGAFAP